jgi:hypothetical protein
MNFKIVTTIGPGSWERYGERFAKSFKKYWPSSAQLEIWHHHLGGNVPSYPGVTFRCLDDVDGFKRIVASLGDAAKDGPSLGYAFKAVALAQAVTPDLDWLAFVDADTETFQPVDGALFAEVFDDSADLTYLYRKAVKESEGSWFAFNLRTKEGASLLADYWGLYVSLEAYQYKKSHDNAVLDRLVNIHQAHGLRVKNLAPGGLGLDAFHQSVLGGYMIHYKGPNKDTIADPGLHSPGRYQMLCEVLQHAVKNTSNKTFEIVEVGTWNGSRAIQMAEAAVAAGAKRVKYIGFDTFDEGNDRAHEGHTKPHARLWLVDRRLENYGRMMQRHGVVFTHELVKGNTLKTLPEVAGLVANASFAYIDGGHSYETTLSDYTHLSHVPYVVFDDIIAQPEEGSPEGPRRVFGEISGRVKQLFTSGDGYLGLKQPISLGIVSKPDVPAPQLRQQLTVKPVDSVDKSEQFEHIASNTLAMKHWLKSYQAHEKTALLVSAGPTLPQFLDDIRAKQAAGAVIFAVKHAYPILKKAGIHPDFTVVLDPRPIEGKSTHGIVRTELFEDTGPSDRFLFATMTHPSVREFLEKKGAQLYGWHAFTQGTQSANLPELRRGLVVGGGTCAATRLPTIAFIMGFRRFEFYGFDFYYPPEINPEDLKQQLMVIAIGNSGRHFTTTGELVAAIQDLGHWNKWMVENKLTVTWHGDGAGAEVWKTIVHAYDPPEEYPF